MIFSQDGQRGPEAILAVGSGSSTLALSYADWGLMFPLLGGQGPCARASLGNVLAAGPQEPSVQSPSMCAGLRRLRVGHRSVLSSLWRPGTSGFQDAARRLGALTNSTEKTPKYSPHSGAGNTKPRLQVGWLLLEVGGRTCGPPFLHVSTSHPL